MASLNALALAEKRAHREASKAAAVVAAASTQNASKPERGEASNAHAEKRPQIKKPKSQSDFAKAIGAPILTTPNPPSGEPTTSQITWATPDLEEDVALKLLSQQGQRIFTGASALAAKKTEVIQAVLEKQKVVEDAEADKENWLQKARWYESEIQHVEDLWDEFVECFFHTIIDQIKYLKPGVELRTKGMGTLCVVCDGKWYRGVGKYFVEEKSRDEWITPSPIKRIPLKEDVEREEMKGPTESEMVDLRLGDDNA
ncbi:KfrA protein [Sesbania bispinosa]|nr:KfrA protein [Sesbania bispinosa]